MMGYGWFGSCCGNGFFNVWFFAIIFIVVLLIVIALLRSLFSSRRNYDRSERMNSSTAREILDERYAKGDISKKDYELMKKDLEK